MKKIKQIKTVRSLLCATEETREYLWYLFLSYTLLINQLLDKLPKEEEFTTWRARGQIPRKNLVATCSEILKEETFLEGLPAHFHTSAVLSVSYTFASLFATQNRLRAKCEGKQRWLGVAEQDLELAKTTDFSPEAIREAAAQILEQAEVERQREQEERKEADSNSRPRPIMNLLFNLLDNTQDPLRYRAIAHLLRNGCKVDLEEEDPEKLTLRLSKKRIQIERFQERLNSQSPIGRDPLGERTEQFIEQAIELADTVAEFEAWEQSLSERTANLSTQLNSLPYPLLFDSADDLCWSWEKETASKSRSFDTQAATQSFSTKRKLKQTRVRKRKKQTRPRVCVSFKGKGLSHLRFRLYCDRRQLPIFRQFVQESEANQARKKEDKFSLALFPLRSANLLWVEDSQQFHKNNYRKLKNLWLKWFCEISTQAVAEEIRNQWFQSLVYLCLSYKLPWQTHRLCLHVTIDPRLLTAEGTEAVRQEKITLMGKFLKGLKEADEEMPALKELSDEEQTELLLAEKNRTIATKRNETTLTRLENNAPPPRPSRVAYQSNPDLAVKVAFSREQIVGVAVSGVHQPVLSYHNVKSLLIDPRVQLLEQRSLKLRHQPERLQKIELAPPKKGAESKHTRYKPKISTRQLQLQPYRLLKRWRRLKRKNLIQRQAEQKQGLYRQSQAESNLARYLNHLLARNIVDLCQKWSAKCIILPEFGDLRESIESEIQAKAKRKYPDDDVKRQKQYAKEFRMTFHRWNYKHLTECIRSRAAVVGIPCVAGKQPRLGTLREKAIAVTAIPPKPK